VGRIVPRHWVLLIGVDADARFQCYEPSSGELRTISASDIRLGQLDRVGFPRAFAVVAPERAW
ncbi:MAG TPA: hypothetical protein VFW21_15280, partial [Mycobacterium sp.]|nr:hypothetical protein [Mycobacterium sp.]